MKTNFFNGPAALFYLFVGRPVIHPLKKFASRADAVSADQFASVARILARGMVQVMRSVAWKVFGNDGQFSQLAYGCRVGEMDL
jgi:hypothetical protein